MSTEQLLIAISDPTAIKIPDWATTWLLWLGAAMAAFFVLWLVVAIARAMHRRAYNLTKAETARPRSDVEPSFLKVDEEAREEALRRGDEYVRPADAEAAEEAAAATEPDSIWRRWGLFSRLGIVTIAVAHVAIAVVSSVAMMRDAEEVLNKLSTSECLVTVVTRYWPGFLLALVVIVAEVVQFMRSRNTARPSRPAGK